MPWKHKPGRHQRARYSSTIIVFTRGNKKPKVMSPQSHPRYMSINYGMTNDQLSDEGIFHTSEWRVRTWKYRAYLLDKTTLVLNGEQTRRICEHMPTRIALSTLTPMRITSAKSRNMLVHVGQEDRLWRISTAIFQRNYPVPPRAHLKIHKDLRDRFPRHELSHHSLSRVTTWGAFVLDQSKTWA